MEDSTTESGAPSGPPELVRQLRGWLPVAVGAVLLVLCWVGVSGESDVYRQLPYLVSGGFGGLALVILGSALLVADRLADTDRTRVARQVDDLHALILGAAEAPAEAAVPTARPPDAVAEGNGQAPAPVREAAGDAQAESEAAPAATTTAVQADTAVALPTGHTFHRPTCRLVAGKEPRPVTAAEIEERGLTPCRLCTPDAPAA